jgi:resolvase-like protein/recombinase-like zinc beta ribbon protein/recombinase
MADSPQRAAAYVRESTEEQGQGFSPDAQRQAIAAFAAENTLELIGEYCDFHSGWRKSEERPEFQRLMADAAASKFDVVLVHHTSRFARYQVEARRYKQLLRERLGIRVVSVTQPMGEDHTDPSAFLAESIHEMFDTQRLEGEGTTRAPRRQTAVGLRPRHGHQARRPRSRTGAARAGAVRALRDRPRVRPHARRVAERQGRAQRPRPAVHKDTVREMLCNAAYAGYVSGLRDKSRSIRGLHEPIIGDELFDRVQEVRSWRTRVVKPGRPSEEYLLRKLIHCERCGARMHGCRTGREGMRRYQCSTRRHHGDCEQTMTPAQPLEEQLIDWLHDFQPDPELRRLILDTIQAETGGHLGDDAERRRELTGQLERLRELYPMGDIAKPQYVMRRQIIEEELQRTNPPTSPDLDRAHVILEDFARFWDAEPNPAERRKLLLSLFAQVWAKDNRIVAVKPNPAFASYFTAASEVRATHPKADAGDEATNTGATGLEPATSAVTGQRSNLLSYAPAIARDFQSGGSVLLQYAKARPRSPCRRKLAARPVFD